MKYWDTTWERAGQGLYENSEPTEKEDRSVGLFGLARASFKGYASQEQTQSFIGMCIDILPLTDDEEMYSRAEKTLSVPIGGMQAGVASMILHCLKPCTFPILNANEGNKNVFQIIGVQMVRRSSLDSYIENCRKIKVYRDQHFSCKNYRVYDLAARSLSDFVINPNETIESKKGAVLLFDHNTILYGPPGTGKTYTSVLYAVAICENKPLEEVMKEPYSEVLARYKKLMDSDHRIVFTTFHQSYGYEEFIEGIKPSLDEESGTLGYSVEDGIFKDFCRQASAVNVQTSEGVSIKQHPRIWLMILGGSGLTALKQECFDSNEVRIGWPGVEDEQPYDEEPLSWRAKQMLHAFKEEMEIGDIVFIEKNAWSIDAIGIIAGDYEFDKTLGKYPRKRKVKWIAKNIDEPMIQYLPRGRKQLARVTVCAIDYLSTDVLSNILEKHMKSEEISATPEGRPYVFIIDEINRGNISKIFGELITLIEDTKRAGMPESMEAILPYSGERFSIPKNVFILGTMNSADRSIALMDTALRRRFEFVEMMPDPKVLESIGVGTIIVDGDELNVAKMLDTINRRIEYLYDREHTIGHAFFTKLRDNPTIETLSEIFEKKVIPLLQEYFYEDYEKIQLVLGDNGKESEFKFILDNPLMIRDIFNGTPDIDGPEKCYSIQHDAFLKLQSYKQIGKGL